jgi:hypothetical protein
MKSLFGFCILMVWVWKPHHSLLSRHQRGAERMLRPISNAPQRNVLPVFPKKTKQPKFSLRQNPRTASQAYIGPTPARI